MESCMRTKLKPNPQTNANIFSQVTFFYTLRLFLKGFRKDLDEEDLYETLSVHQAKKLGKKLEDSWLKECEISKQPSLWKAMWRIFGLKYTLLGLVLIIIDGFAKISQLLALAQLMENYNVATDKHDKQHAYTYASIIIGTSCINAFFFNWYSLQVDHLGMQIRIALSALIYRKTLRLTKASLAGTTTGQLVNLLSSDVNSFNNLPYYGHILCQVPTQTVLITYVLYHFLGLTSVVGALFLLVLTPLQGYLGNKVGSVHLKALLKTDERVRIMNEIITSIKVIKMYTWEKPLIKLVNETRRAEIKHIRNASFIRGSLLSFWVVLPRFANFLSILTYTLLGNVITASYAFLINALYKFMGDSVVYSLYLGIPKIAEANVSLARITKIMYLEEVDYYLLHKSLNNPSNNKIGPAIEIENGFAKWLKTSFEYTLRAINLKVNYGELLAVVGPVGCGKTSLLNVILKELPLQTGRIRINGSVSYASQEPWLFSGTIKQNILFGQSMDIDRYKEVVRVCALEPDFIRLPYGDNTSIGEKGTMLSGGQRARINLARAVYRDADIYLLDDSLSAIDTHVGKEVFENCILGFLSSKCRIIVTHQLQYIGSMHQVLLIENGTIATSSGYKDEKECGINFVRQLSEGKENIVDLSNNSEDSELMLSCQKVLDETPFENKETKFSGGISANCYLMYFKLGGSFCTALLISLLFILTQISSSSADYFIAYWVNSEQDLAKNSTKTLQISKETSVSIYSGLIFGTGILALVRTLAFFRYCMMSSTKLHDSMFSNIIHAPMKFFNTNPSGRILNRFSRDIGVIDDNLPVDMFKCIQVGLTVLGIMVLVCVVYKWLFAASAIILGILCVLKVIYSATSRDLKRLEGSSRSPVYTHMCETLRGLTTIRAFGNQNKVISEFEYYQDMHTSCFYLYISCWRAFCLWLEIICTTYIALVIFGVLYLKHEKYGGNLGLTITQAISLTGLLQKATSAWCELENQMTSVERVVEYTKIQQENSPETKDVDHSWPQEGAIDFHAVSLKYFPEEPYVLKEVDINIAAKEKVGIVGRTGAGKSSLITALFQLSRTEGTILIDNIDIKNLSLSSLRQKISIIPQEPILFSGTFRKNLDPFDEYTDLELWNVLEEVGLNNLVSELSLGLNSKVLEGGCNFSIGQKQLICLARAIIKKNKILVLDEATANVDVQTDILIQKTIRRKFEECTVLTIAHRLNTIMDSHKVLVMDEGRVVEYNHPHILLKNKNGALYGMVEQTGIAASKSLTGIAKLSFGVISKNT